MNMRGQEESSLYLLHKTKQVSLTHPCNVLWFPDGPRIGQTDMVARSQDTAGGPAQPSSHDELPASHMHVGVGNGCSEAAGTELIKTEEQQEEDEEKALNGNGFRLLNVHTLMSF